LCLKAFILGGMQNPLRILLLILSGEAIFLLPFVLARVFRPTFLAVFELSNTQLGSCYSLYGIVALICYFLGGTVADHFPPRKLMALALFLTALGGFYMYTLPSFEALQLLYVYWGFTSIFLFWSAMIKATRAWGGQAHQGKAFGFLEGGRGFFAASLGTLGVLIFAWVIPSEIGTISLDERQEASWTDIKKAFSNSSVRYLMLIVLSASIGYKVTDVFSLYASEIMLFDEVDAAKVGSYQMYLRPFICVLVGFFADRTSNALVLCYAFACMLLGALLFATGWVVAPAIGLFILTLVITALGTYALRAVYFATMEEGKIPFAITGTAVGLISLVGYTPDIFVGPIMGFFLDGSPGIWGHQQLFLFLATFSLIGLYASYRFMKIIRK
jgi:MFS family permease